VDTFSTCGNTAVAGGTGSTEPVPPEPSPIRRADCDAGLVCAVRTPSGMESARKTVSFRILKGHLPGTYRGSKGDVAAEAVLGANAPSAPTTSPLKVSRRHGKNSTATCGAWLSVDSGQGTLPCGRVSDLVDGGETTILDGPEVREGGADRLARGKGDTHVVASPNEQGVVDGVDPVDLRVHVEGSTNSAPPSVDHVVSRSVVTAKLQGQAIGQVSGEVIGEQCIRRLGGLAPQKSVRRRPRSSTAVFMRICFSLSIVADAVPDLS